MFDWKAGRFAPPFAIRPAGCMGAPAHRFYLSVDQGAAHDQPEVGRAAAETHEVVFRHDPCSVAPRRRRVSVPP